MPPNFQYKKNENWATILSQTTLYGPYDMVLLTQCDLGFIFGVNDVREIPYSLRQRLYILWQDRILSDQQQIFPARTVYFE